MTDTKALEARVAKLERESLTLKVLVSSVWEQMTEEQKSDALDDFIKKSTTNTGE